MMFGSWGYCIDAFREGVPDRDIRFFQRIENFQRIEKKEKGYWRRLLRLQDGQIGKVRTVNRDLYIVFGKFFRSFQLDLYFLILLLLDRDRLFQVVMMQAQALNRDIILSGGD